MRRSALFVALVFTFVATVSPAGAQTAHSASQSAIDAALQQKVAEGRADRDTVLRLLDRPEVAAVAGDAGLDLRRAKDAVSTMNAQDVAALAAQASQVEQSLAGGQSITISTTLLIIGLLVLILIILAVD